MPAPSASGFDLLCRNTTIATADRQQTNATTITALVVAAMPKFSVGPQPVGTSRVFPQPARTSLCKQALRKWIPATTRAVLISKIASQVVRGLLLRQLVELVLSVTNCLPSR